MRTPMLAALAALAVALFAGAPSASGAPPRSVLQQGAACEPGGAKACEAGLYCKREFGACVANPQGQGTCKPVPDICNDEVKPVCGCNGKTYENACLAEIDDANVAHEGSCNSSDVGQKRQ